MSVPAEEEEEVVFLGKVEAEDEEQSLTEQLEQQQAQLDAINEQLEVDPSSEDLQQLKGSLDELVGLLQGELLRVKKAKLLSVVEAQFESSSSSSQPQQNNVESKESSSESSSSSSSSSSEEESTSLSAIIEQFNGQECSVPFGASDQYHDAILKVENEGKNLRTPESLLFNAFFLYPLTQSMLTCPFYLKGSCRFTSTSSKTCKYSHGHRVTVQQIRPKAVYSIGEEVNYQKDGDNCNRKLFGLVRNSALPTSSSSSSGEGSKDDHQHHLWTRCEIVKTDPGTGRVLVKLVRDCTDFWVPMEMLVLVDQQFEKEEEEIEVPAMMSSQTESSEPSSTTTNSATPSSSFGEWERYTSGIGSKLLLKMGYTSGTGLGSRAQGILHPIESYVFPPGHSLDACFTLKAESERKKLDIEEVMKEKKKERRLEAKRAKQYEKAVEKSREKAENNSVFRLLDDMFHSGSSSASASTSASSSFGSSKKQKVKSEPTRNQTKNLDAKSLALSAFKVDEELKKAEAELRRYEESFRRNSKGTPSGKLAEVQGDLSLKTIQQKRDRARAVVDGLRRRQVELGRETTLRKDKQKMIF